MAIKKIHRYAKSLLVVGLCVAAAAFAVGKSQAAGELIGYWNFDEASGVAAADASGNANNGTLTGSGVTQSTVLPPTSCFINTHSMQFNGSGGYVSIPDNATMDPTTAISIAFWMKPNTVSNGYQHIVFKQGPVVTSYGVWLNGDHIYMEDNDDNVRSLASNATVTAGEWHYVTVTYDGTTQKLYIDGTLDNSQSLPGISLTYSNSPVKVGAGDYNNPFSGYVDDLRIYGRALTDSEIASLAGGGCGPGVVPNNGLPDGEEDAGPHGGDANDDGQADSQQANVASFTNTQTPGYVAVATPAACTLSALTTAAASANSKPDAGYSYPAGLVNYSADCGTPGYSATVKLYFYEVNQPASVLRKYNPTTQTYATVAGAVLSRTTIGGQAVTVATYQVTDGGELDSDGVANGTIVDPVGLAVAPVSAAVPAVAGAAPADTLINAGVNLAVSTSLAAGLIVTALGVRYSDILVKRKA